MAFPRPSALRRSQEGFPFAVLPRNTRKLPSADTEGHGSFSTSSLRSLRPLRLKATIPFPCVPWLFPTRRNSDAHQTKFRCPSEKFLMGIRKRSDGHQKVLQCPLDGPVAPNALNPTAVTLSTSAATSETALTSAVQTTPNPKGHNHGNNSPFTLPAYSLYICGYGSESPRPIRKRRRRRKTVFDALSLGSSRT